jgi:hypothetical protein
MNPIPTIRQLLKVEPFKPFTIFISDGGRITVRHPETVAFSPNEKSIFVYTKNEDFQFVSPLHITRVEGAIKV